jgi:general secretion pathway protein L
MAKRILGLDVGSHSGKAVELRQTLRWVEVVQLRRFSLDDPAPALSSELREFAGLYDLPRGGVVVALAGDRVSTRSLEFPFTDKRKIAAAVPFEIESQLPFDLDGYLMDWQPVQAGGERSEVAVSLAPQAEVALLLETLAEAGIEARVVEAEGLVLANLSAVVDLPGTRLLADIGHRKTTLCLCCDGQPLAARTIPVAGQAITQALAKERLIDEVEAERVKAEAGVLGGPSHPESPASVAIVDRLAREIVRTLGSFESQLSGADRPAVSRIDLLGGSAHLHRLDEYLTERVGLPASRLSLPQGDLGAALIAGGDPLTFAPATALALRGSARAVTRINLRQGELEARVDLRGMARELRWTALMAALVLLLAGASMISRLALSSQLAEQAEQEARSLVTQAFPNRPVTGSPVAAMQEAVRTAEKRANTLGVYRGNLSALDILTEISRRVPADLDVVFEELSIDRQVVVIKGHSPSFGSVDELRAELGEFAPFSDISVGDITADARRGGQTFSVRISLSGEGEPS